MKKLFMFFGLLGLLATQPAASCRKKEKKAKVVKAKDNKELKNYTTARSK
jgi:hypothetical protein